MASNESDDLFHSWTCDLCRPWLWAVVWDNLWGCFSKMWSGVICEDVLVRWYPSTAGSVGGGWLGAWLWLRPEGCGYFSVGLPLGTSPFSPQRSRGWSFLGIWTQTDAELRFKGAGQTPRSWWGSNRNWGVGLKTNNISKKGKKNLSHFY